MPKGKPFQPGASGNPKGRPRLGESLAETLRLKMPPDRVVAEAEKLLKSKNEATRARVLEWWVERGYGRVPQDVDLDIHAVGPEAQAMLGAIALTPHERRARLRAAEGVGFDADLRGVPLGGSAAAPAAPVAPVAREPDADD